MDQQAGNMNSNFKIQFPGNKDVKTCVQNKLQQIKRKLSQLKDGFVSNTDVINAVFDCWLSNNSDGTHPTGTIGSYQEVSQCDTMQDLFITSADSLQSIVDRTYYHSRYCSHSCKVTKRVRRGHVIVATVTCSNQESPHTFSWSSSPYLPNKEYLANHRVCHAMVCSGMLPVHYTRFANAAGIGCVTRGKRKIFHTNYKESVQSAHDKSIEDALLDEIGAYEELDGIEIMSDARHGWRKNAKDTSVVAIGERTHKVLKCEHVTKADDTVSQRHEMNGTRKIYDYFASKDVSIKVHTHDRNMAVNRFVKDTAFTQNQNDYWHGVKSMKKSLKAISTGPQYKEGTTWSRQLEDKAEPVATHVHWAMKNCKENPQVLRQNLDSVVKHYKNEHDNCLDTSRCKTDINYEPSRTVITNPKGEKMLENAIKSSVIYKSPEDFILSRSSSYVESFNNVMNIFQDKRIAFSDMQYNLRSQLAVLHWNENVDREFTSIWNPRTNRAPRQQKGKKNYKAVRSKYRNNIWNLYMRSMFEGRPRRR